MNSDLLEIVLPSFAFFLGFFLLYTILEMLTALSLNLIIFHYWGFATEVVNLPKMKRDRRIELTISLFIAFSIVAMVCYSKVINILLASAIEIRVFTVEVFLAMLFIYLVTTHELLDDQFIKKIHKYLYFYMSSVIFVLAILFSNQYYAAYQNYIHANLIYPIAKNRSMTLESSKRRRLLTEFRHMIYSQLCPEADFSSYYRGGGAVNFVYVVTHPDLKIAKKPLSSSDMKAHLSGRLCSSGGTSFLLTDHGQWYWVIRDERIAQK